MDCKCSSMPRTVEVQKCQKPSDEGKKNFPHKKRKKKRRKGEGNGRGRGRDREKRMEKFEEKLKCGMLCLRGRQNSNIWTILA